MGESALQSLRGTGEPCVWYATEVCAHLARNKWCSLASGGVASCHGELTLIHLTPSSEPQPGFSLHPEGGRGKDRVCKLIMERVCLVLFVPLASKPEPLLSNGT